MNTNIGLLTDPQNLSMVARDYFQEQKMIYVWISGEEVMLVMGVMLESEGV